jgi:hypothetical protein
MMLGVVVAAVTGSGRVRLLLPLRVCAGLAAFVTLEPVVGQNALRSISC